MKRYLEGPTLSLLFLIQKQGRKMKSENIDDEARCREPPIIVKTSKVMQSNPSQHWAGICQCIFFKFKINFLWI